MIVRSPYEHLPQQQGRPMQASKTNHRNKPNHRILYTTTTQRGLCTEAFVSILAHLQSQNCFQEVVVYRISLPKPLLPTRVADRSRWDGDHLSDVHAWAPCRNTSFSEDRFYTTTTTTTQRGWCIQAFVSILAHLQSQKLLPGVWNLSSHLLLWFASEHYAGVS